MDPRLIDQRRYLAALHAAAAAEPDVHRNQLAALDRERALAASSDDPHACRIASGDLFELARAGWLDRLVAHARVAAALDDPWTTQAAAVEVAATLAARGHADWTATLAAGSEAAARWHHRAAEVKSAGAGLIAAVMEAAWDRREGAQGAARIEAAARWRTLTSLEPAVAGDDGRARFERMLAQRRYRQRSPFAGAGQTALVDLLARTVLPEPEPLEVELPPASELLAAIEADVARWRTGLATATPGPLVGGEPTVDDVIAPYAALTALPGTEPTTVALVASARRLVAAAHGAATAQAVLAAWVEGDLVADFAAAPVRAHAETTLARAALWPDPVLVAGARALLADLSGIRTGTAVDLVAVHHDACAAIEGTWNRDLAAALFAPIQATAIAGWDPAGAPSIAAGWRFAHGLVGTGDGLLAIPRVAAVIELVASRDQRVEALGAFRGEIGHTLVSDCRTWFDVRKLPSHTVGEVERAVTAAWGTPPAPASRPVQLWDREVALAELDRPPPRPPVPGRSGRARS